MVHTFGGKQGPCCREKRKGNGDSAESCVLRFFGGGSRNCGYGSAWFATALAYTGASWPIDVARPQTPCWQASRRIGSRGAGRGILERTGNDNSRKRGVRTPMGNRQATDRLDRLSGHLFPLFRGRQIYGGGTGWRSGLKPMLFGLGLSALGAVLFVRVNEGLSGRSCENLRRGARSRG